MGQFDNYKSTPFGSLVTRSQAEQDHFAEQLIDLPPSIIEMILSPKIAAFIRGLARSYNVPPESSFIIAFIVLRVALGDKTLKDIPLLVAAELQIPSPQAQKLSQEIEKELFAPIMLEYNTYLTGKKKAGTTTTSLASGARNVLDLKNHPSPPPVPPPLPRSSNQ